MPRALLDDFSTMLTRELDGIAREIALFPDDAAVWRTCPGVTNSAGNLALHVAGNLRHFVGVGIGAIGYVRNREIEFGRREGTRSEIVEELARARATVLEVLGSAPPSVLEVPLKHPMMPQSAPVQRFLVHLCAHAAYHLGQIGYLRRILTGENRSAGALPLEPLAADRKEMRVTDDTSPCPVCGETIKSAAIKCRFCNTDLAAHHAAKEAEVERELFLGRPQPITSIFEWALVVATLGIAFLYYLVRSLSVHYRITTQRVQIEHGLFSTTKDNVELFRIDHFDLHKPFGMRILNQCTLHLRSSDPHFPTVMLKGVPQLEQLADTLRECSLRERTRRRVTTFVEA